MEVPPGVILMWSKPIAAIPHGWSLCDGTQGTPDLRGRFIIGAGGIYDPGDIGGDNAHDHNFETDGHSHAIPAGNDIEFGSGFADDTSVNNDNGITQIASSLPRYYALSYIMKK